MRFSLLSMELLKVRKRWLFYVLLLTMLAGAAIHVWLGGYTTWRSSNNVDTHELQLRSQALHTFVLPYALPALLDSGQFWGSLLVGILTASMVATEYSWGTVRQAIARGQTRSDYLLVKLSGIGVVSTVMLVVTLGIGIVMAIWATSIAGQDVTFHASGGPSALGAIVMILRAGYCILPYALFAFLLAVVGRSTTLGVAGITLYMIIESIIVAILLDLHGPAPMIRSFILGHNVAAVLGANAINGAQYNTMAFRNLPDPSKLPDPWVGALVIGVYCLVFLAITFFVFQRRDMTAGAGAS
jgi:ABC-type transport system involved in multi-copper enzyme maturation permease subunit